MGLTIKGQCIPDVSEPVEARGRTAGFSEAALAGCGGEGAVRDAEQGAARGSRQEADRRLRHREAYGHPAGEPRRWLLGDPNTPTPRVASGARSPSPRGCVCHLPQGSPSRPLLPSREGGSAPLARARTQTKGFVPNTHGQARTEPFPAKPLRPGNKRRLPRLWEREPSRRLEWLWTKLAGISLS
ncbi:uncharacterized protein [Odocoileus virginianus]|uniref:Uncharacterized protein n=1 Tax=Odocoileus virginianus TaxID=9874 RepID=A0ABM4IWA0_ODOVR